MTVWLTLFELQRRDSAIVTSVAHLRKIAPTACIAVRPILKLWGEIATASLSIEYPSYRGPLRFHCASIYLFMRAYLSSSSRHLCLLGLTSQHMRALPCRIHRHVASVQQLEQWLLDRAETMSNSTMFAHAGRRNAN